MLENIGNSLKQQLDVAKEKTIEAVDIAANKMSSMKEAGMDKIKSLMDEVSNGIPLFEEAGFKLDGISIDLGLPPDVSIGFTKTNEVSAETIATLIEENKEKKMLFMILTALQTANNLQNMITLNQFVFAGASIQLGLPPKVGLKYK